jgi:hypothetical protein
MISFVHAAQISVNDPHEAPPKSCREQNALYSARVNEFLTQFAAVVAAAVVVPLAPLS